MHSIQGLNIFGGHISKDVHLFFNDSRPGILMNMPGEKGVFAVVTLSLAATPAFSLASRSVSAAAVTRSASACASPAP